MLFAIGVMLFSLGVALAVNYEYLGRIEEEIFMLVWRMVGSYNYMVTAVVGIIIVSALEFIMAVLLHLNTNALDFVIAIASVIVFTGLTAYDAQKIRNIAEHSNSSESYQKLSILAALEIYLNFINIFLSLLRLFGRQDD